MDQDPHLHDDDDLDGCLCDLTIETAEITATAICRHRPAVCCRQPSHPAATMKTPAASP